MTEKEREEFKRKREEKKARANNEQNQAVIKKQGFNLIELFKKAEAVQPVNTDALTPYEREELKNSYKMLTLILIGISFVLILWIISWVM
jgi:hypothetical protein